MISVLPSLKSFLWPNSLHSWEPNFTLLWPNSTLLQPKSLEFFNEILYSFSTIYSLPPPNKFGFNNLENLPPKRAKPLIQGWIRINSRPEEGCRIKITLTWFLCGLYINIHLVILKLKKAFPPNAATWALTIARTSVTKLWMNPLKPPLYKQDIDW